MFLGALSIPATQSACLIHSQQLPTEHGVLYHGYTKIYRKMTRTYKYENNRIHIQLLAVLMERHTPQFLVTR